MDGKALADKICLDLKARCDVLKSRNINPVLTIVTSGEDSASKVYVRNKVKRCEEIGIKADVRHYDYLPLSTPLRSPSSWSRRMSRFSLL